MIFRLTKSAVEQIAASCGEDQRATNRYCDWFVDTVTCDGNTYFLLTNSFSLFSVLIPAKGLDSAESFTDTAEKEIQAYFNHKGLSSLFAEFMEADLGNAVITKTNNRSVLAAMRGMKINLSVGIRMHNAPHRDGSLFAVDDDLNSTPCKCLSIRADDYTIAKYFISCEKMREPVPELAVPASPRKGNTAKRMKPVYCLCVELEGFKPKIWRRIHVPADFSMAKLAYTLISVFKAQGAHLYAFEIPVRKNAEKLLKANGCSKKEVNRALSFLQDIEIESYIDPEMDAADDDFAMDIFRQLPPRRLAARTVKLSNVVDLKNPEFYFTYDFGDGWRFKIKLEDADCQSSVPAEKLPLVIAGQGYGIIEDCGGIGGLESLRLAFKQKSGEDYEEFKEWLGCDDLDLSFFDIEAANAAIKGDIRSFNSTYKEMEENAW